MAAKTAIVGVLLCFVSASTRGCVVSTLPWKRYVESFICVCGGARITDLFYKSAFMQLQLSIVVKNNTTYFLWCIVQQQACVYSRLLRTTLHAFTQTLYSFFGRSSPSHKRQLCDRTPARQPLPPCLAKKCSAIKASMWTSFSSIVDRVPRLEAHTPGYF